MLPLDANDADSADNIYKDLIRGNIVSGNRCFEKWAAIGKMFDGNGIIVDWRASLIEFASRLFNN